ncbi:MAG: aldo/keto reductase [Anaerolineaceae bacterium]|nr:aldo/keto reductase [Anaerolineaceae bacterium]
MEYRRLGTTGMQVSAISIGAWLTYGSSHVDDEQSIACLRTAIDNGINFIDVANIYAHGGAEETVGDVIKDYDRTKLVVSTKTFFPMSEDVNDQGLSRKNIMQSVEKSLKRLGTDYIDIFFCHRYDPHTRVDETVRAIEDLIRQGKILYWGTSMWTGSQIDEAVQAADQFNAYRPVVEQPIYNMLDRHAVEGGLEDTLGQHGIGLVVWSPLAGGLLTGKYDKGIPGDSRAATFDQDFIKEGFAEFRLERARKISQLATQIEVKPAALALAWALKHHHVDSVITGATKPQHVLSNLEALKINLTPEIEEAIEEILNNKPPSSMRTIVHPDEIAAL